MNEPKPQTLGSAIRAARQRAHLSARQLAERVNTAHSQINRIESGQTSSPNPQLVARIADELDINSADLHSAAGWQNPGALPSFTPYLRSKYRGLPPAAQAELRDSFQEISRKYGYDAAGPGLGEDESEDTPTT